MSTSPSRTDASVPPAAAADGPPADDAPQPPDVALDELRVGEREHWTDGPPHEQFARMRRGCPVHWSAGTRRYPSMPGFWSVTRAEDLQTVSRDWRTFSSELGGMLMIPEELFSVAMQNSMFIGMDPPRHDRLKALFSRGFTPKRIEEHEDRIRAIVSDVLDGVADRERIDVVADVAGPAVSRVIGSFMGLPPEDDEPWARIINAMMTGDDEELHPEGPHAVFARELPQVFERCQELVTARRAQPTDDLTSVLVHAEVDGERLDDQEVVMGFFLLMTAGNDSTKATYSAAMRALLEHPDQRALLLEDPDRIPGAVEEALRMFPAFAHFRRTATRDVELGGQAIREGDAVLLWYPSSGRDEERYEDPDRFDVTRCPEHQAFGAGGRHFCLGAALARLELRVLLEETLARFPDMVLDGEPRHATSTFANQLATLPVRLHG